MQPTKNLLYRISQLPKDWHLSGTVSSRILHRIAVYAEQFDKIGNTIETGAGKTTLLFSHLSSNHHVFALESNNGSISAVKNSELFNDSTVTFHEGPTQIELPLFTFESKFTIALLDGPHAYPFPDLEYFFIYPHIDLGGLLLLDDIHIPSIRRMFEIIKADDMFELMEVTDDMAFFRRTKAPLFNPYGDGWGDQGFNRKHWQKMKRAIRKAEMIDNFIPDSVKSKIPNSIKRWFLNLF